MCVIDLTYLIKISNNNQTFIKEMIESFLECAPQYLSELRAFSQEHDWANVKMTAHKLKPSATYLGLPHLLELILSVEEEVDNKQTPESISQLVLQMHELCEKAYPRLQEMAEKGKFD